MTLLKATGSAVIIAYLFFDSALGLLCTPVLYLLFRKRDKQREKERKEQELEGQFVQGLQVLSDALEAGISMENAWKEVEKESGILYGTSTAFYKELQEINNQVASNVPIEQLLLGFAERNPIKDIVNFCEIFAYGKRTGGDWNKIIGNTVARIKERYEIEKEIQVLLAAKVMEQKVLNIIPLGMILFLKVYSPTYMKVLYHNPFGVICMVACLLIYIVAILWAEKITKIQV